MSRVHDMGGRFGDGPVVPEPQDALVFDESWHGRALAVTLACGALGRWNLDISRHAQELAGGVVSRSNLAERVLRTDAVAGVLAKGGPADRPGPAPAFAVGQRVRTRHPARNVFVPGGHTRLPGYAAGVEGTVLRCHGAHVLPDSHAHDLGEQPEPLYTVVFDAGALWGAPERAGDEVTCDLWQSYLEAL